MHPFGRGHRAQYGCVVGIGPLLRRPVADMIERVDDLRPVEHLVMDNLALIELEPVAPERFTNPLANEFQRSAIRGGFGFFVVRCIALFDNLFGFTG